MQEEATSCQTGSQRFGVGAGTGFYHNQQVRTDQKKGLHPFVPFQGTFPADVTPSTGPHILQANTISTAATLGMKPPKTLLGMITSQSNHNSPE